MSLPRRAAGISTRSISLLAIALLSLSSPQEASAQISLTVGNCVATTATFNDTERVCASGTNPGEPGSDPGFVCVVPSTGGTAADDVTPDGCNEITPATTFINEILWAPPTLPDSYVVVFFASDETNTFQNILITDSSNTAPTATAQSLSTDEDTPLPITLTGTDPESDALTFAVVTQPSHGTLSGILPNLTYTPDANYNGADSFTFTASDASLTSDPATVSITVNPGNDAPTATPQSLSTAEDTALSITLTGTDPESNPLTFTVVTQPSHGTLSGILPNLTYTPDLNYNGADSFTFTASDASLTSDPATVSITVNPGNDAPTATPQSLSTAEDTALPITLTGTDPESDALTFAVVTQPSHGTLSGTMPNLTYTPDPNYNGADSFTFTASDGSLTSAAATISITVTAGNGSGQTFNDVPTDYWAFSFIETLAASGITAGCGNNNYCPEDAVSRAQMAVFLERGMNGSDYVPPAAQGNVFLDVGAGDFAANFIEQLYSDGITAGCGNYNYCPDTEVSRSQMAVFLLRAKYGQGYSPPTATGVYNDVDLSYWAVHWIEALTAEGITAGCGNGNYCPEDAVTRAQMAVFLVRTFDL